MRIVVSSTENLVTLLRRVGYVFQKHATGGEMAFVRRLSDRGDFPRFHIYAKDVDFGKVYINIHLDARRETHGHAPAHSGEYGDDGALAAEVARLKSLLDVVD